MVDELVHASAFSLTRLRFSNRNRVTEGEMGKMDARQEPGKTDKAAVPERSAAKPRLSPELQELMHMLTSLERQFARDNDER
jgi:hypothetical protein